MELSEAFVLAVRIVVIATVFAAGLDTPLSDLRLVARRPRLVLRSIAAMMLISPLVAIALTKLIPVGPAATIAIVVGAISPGLPTLPRTGTALASNRTYATVLEALSAVLAVVVVPVWLSVLASLFGVAIEVPPRAIVLALGLMLIAPLFLGMVLRQLLPALAEKMAAPLAALSTNLVHGLVLVVLLVGLGALARLPWIALVVMLVVIGVALAVGHLLGGPEPRDRTVLAIANAGRFPMLGALVAQLAFPDARAVPVVLLFTILSASIALTYGRWRKRTLEKREPPGRGATPARPAELGTPQPG